MRSAWGGDLESPPLYCIRLLLCRRGGYCGIGEASRVGSATSVHIGPACCLGEMAVGGVKSVVAHPDATEFLLSRPSRGSCMAG